MEFTTKELCYGDIVLIHTKDLYEKKLFLSGKG